MTEHKAPKLYFGGIPTEPDIKKLEDVFGTPTEGTRYQWSRLEEVLGCDRRSRRFGTIIWRWRKRLLAEHNIFMRAIRGDGLEAANPTQRVVESAGRFRSGLRKVRRASTLAGSTDRSRLSPEDRRVADHLVATAATMQGVANTSAKQLEYPDPQKSVDTDPSVVPQEVRNVRG